MENRADNAARAAGLLGLERAVEDDWVSGDRTGRLTKHCCIQCGSELLNSLRASHRCSNGHLSALKVMLRDVMMRSFPVLF